MTEHHGNAPPDSRRHGVVPAEPVVAIHADDGARAEIRRHGAHVTSWCPAPTGEERLFLSASSDFGAGSAIRGGVPVIFPQFSTEGPLPKHGFARTTEWALGGVGRSSNGMAEAELVLRDGPDTRAIWDSAFEAVVTVRLVGARLAISLRVENTGERPFSFTAALHTYLRVQNADDVRILGLRGARYRVPGDRTLVVDDEESVRVGESLERVYVGAPPRIDLHEGSRCVTLESEGFTDAVLWNPGAAAAAALPDMEPGGERRFVCIEAAIVQTPVDLAPRRRWTGTQILTAR